MIKIVRNNKNFLKFNLNKTSPYLINITQIKIEMPANYLNCGKNITISNLKKLLITII